MPSPDALGPPVAQVDEIHQRGVVLSVERTDLNDPRIESARRRSGGPEQTLERRLRQALDWITAHF